MTKLILAMVAACALTFAAATPSRAMGASTGLLIGVFVAVAVIAGFTIADDDDDGEDPASA